MPRKRKYTINWSKCIPFHNIQPRRSLFNRNRKYHPNKIYHFLKNDTPHNTLQRNGETQKKMASLACVPSYLTAPTIRLTPSHTDTFSFALNALGTTHRCRWKSSGKSIRIWVGRIARISDGSVSVFVNTIKTVADFCHMQCPNGSSNGRESDAREWLCFSSDGTDESAHFTNYVFFYSHWKGSRVVTGTGLVTIEIENNCKWKLVHSFWVVFYLDFGECVPNLSGHFQREFLLNMIRKPSTNQPPTKHL